MIEKDTTTGEQPVCFAIVHRLVVCKDLRAGIGAAWVKRRRLPLNGRGLRLSDVATVEYTFPEQESFNFLNGVEALTFRVNKTSGARRSLRSS